MAKTDNNFFSGKSVLQNELLGDLEQEFGNLPDHSEDIPLDELGKTLQTTFTGDTGKQSSSLIAKMVSTKMPGGFSSGSMRNYLESRWGLGLKRQQGIMLLALDMQPTARLSSDTAAKAFFDSVVAAYSLQTGVDLAALAGKGAAVSSRSNVVLDSAAIEAATKDQRNLSARQLELLAAHLKVDFRAADKALLMAQKTQNDIQARLDVWDAEHGEIYSDGIMPAFDSLKVRVYDSCWNWVREDVLHLYYDLVFAKIQLHGQELEARKHHIINRASLKLCDFLQYLLINATSQQSPGYGAARLVTVQLIDRCEAALYSPPVYKNSSTLTAPRTTIDLQGIVSYIEVSRAGVTTFEDYVQEMKNRIQTFENSYRRTRNHMGQFFGFPEQQLEPHDEQRLKSEILYEDRMRLLSPDGLGPTTPPEDEINDTFEGHEGVPEPVNFSTLPFLYLKQLKGSKWEYNGKHSRLYLDSLQGAARSGLTFQGKTVLITGTGTGSIGAMVLEGLLAGGAKVIATTSRYTQKVTEYYRAIYTRHGARGSELILMPFNQGSKHDVRALIGYIYDTEKGLGWDLDHVLPFAAISENGTELDGIDSKSELAHRIMLVNLLRLLGFIKKHKLSKGYSTRPSQVILPLSPNHGTFGGDGLYSESKIALESLFNKWHSEEWGGFLTICGANIGWTRGTGLMSGNNIIAEKIEGLGVRTFSQQEMAFNILGLMTPAVRQLCEMEPVYADLTGSLDSIPDLKTVTAKIREGISDQSEARKIVAQENVRETVIVGGRIASTIQNPMGIEPRANLNFRFPELPDFKAHIAPLGKKLSNMVDLEKVVVVTGFSELGPWGNSRTRWEMEACGKLSLEGCVEMAWIMGLIKHHNGPVQGRQGRYTGWVDTKDGHPISDGDVKLRYEKHILEHTGIRLVEPELLEGRDNRTFQQMVIQEDLLPFEASEETAKELKRQHGEQSEVFPIAGSDNYSVRLKIGATVEVPKALDYSHYVAAQIPTGWDARRYGIPDDIISQVDKVTLYVLVCTAEALLSAGITDAYEIYQYVHLSEIGNCIGSGLGGGNALSAIFKDRTYEKPVQSDILQESFINTIGAWVNMLLMSSSGPLRTPVGACATGIESMDIGYDTIVSGKAKLCLVGACDSYREEFATEFGNMKATSDAKYEAARGRTPKEMSRPTTTTRSGFVESEGCGVQVLTNAKLALDMGLPIYGIVALTALASDKIGRSVPAPGQGILTVAQEEKADYPSPLLDITYRKEQLTLQLQGIQQWQDSEVRHLQQELASEKMKQRIDDASGYAQNNISHIVRKANCRRREALSNWGNDFWKQEPSISPLRGVLATWGLSIDDLNVASFHGTSTVANDRNESDVICKQLRHLGRQKGNAILAICQKHLTGHPKGPAGSWMFNGCLQVLNSGVVPGNRNADNLDKDLERFDLICYPSQSIQTDGIKAFSVTSFGFGQKSAQAVGIHPRYLFATLDEDSYSLYKLKVEARQKRAYQYTHRGLINNNLFQAKEKAPYTPEQETQLLLSPNARAIPDSASFNFSAARPVPNKLQEKIKSEYQYKSTVDELCKGVVSMKPHIGVDIEDINAIATSSEVFIARNFSDKEQAYCKAAPSPRASFAGRWSAKEAAFKALGVPGKGSGASMKEIEITSDANGAPLVVVSHDWFQFHPMFPIFLLR